MQKIKTIFLKMFFQYDEKKAQQIRKAFFTKKKRFFADREPESDYDCTTDSETEIYERREQLKTEEPTIHLNQTQLRSLLAQHFFSQHGTRPSLANSRLGQFAQRISTAYNRTLSPGHQPEPKWRIFYEVKI